MEYCFDFKPTNSVSSLDPYSILKKPFFLKFLEWYSECVVGKLEKSNLVIYLFGVLRRFQHCTGHITTGSWKGRGNQYIQFARVVYCKLPNNGKQLPAFPLKAVTGIKPRPQRWEARVLPLCHRGPLEKSKYLELTLYISFGVGTDSSFATIFNKKESVSLYNGCTVYRVP